MTPTKELMYFRNASGHSSKNGDAKNYEVMAENIIYPYEKRFELLDQNLVNIKHLVENQYGFNIRVEPNLDFWGRCVFSSTIREITVSADITHEAQRFTIAHELAHFIHADRLGHTTGEITDPAESISQNLEIKHEESAMNRFAAALLMPRHKVVRVYNVLLDRHGLRLQKNGLHYDNPRNRHIWKHQLLPDFKNAFVTSISAMIFRLSEVRLNDGTVLLPPEFKSHLLTSAPDSKTNAPLKISDAINRSNIFGY